MKKHSMPEMKEGGVNVTPLIDVVMCLIIFFMLVAKIGVSTGAVPMTLPTTILGKKIEELPDTLFVNVLDPTLDREANGTPKHEDESNPKSPLIHLANTANVISPSARRSTRTASPRTSSSRTRPGPSRSAPSSRRSSTPARRRGRRRTSA